MKTLKLFFFFFFISAAVFSQEKSYPLRTVEGKKFLVYSVQPGDGWYGIARTFGITYSQLRFANKQSDDKLFPGREVLIPIDKLKSNDPFFQKNYLDASNAPPAGSDTIYHSVKPSQTLYSISRIYKVPVEQIRKWNGLSSNEINKGQALIVGIISTNRIKEEPAPEITPVPEEVKTEPSMDYSRFVVPVPAEEQEIEASRCEEPVYINRTYNQFPTNEIADSICMDKDRKNEAIDSVPGAVMQDEEKIIYANGRKEVTEEGIALIAGEEDANTEKYFAYHPTLQPGTIVMVTNFVNLKKVFVKVTGKLTPSSDDNHEIIRISKAAAERLGMTENKMQVRLQYGVNNEEK